MWRTEAPITAKDGAEEAKREGGEGVHLSSETTIRVDKGSRRPEDEDREPGSKTGDDRLSME
ncbi:hypothetical protein IscW_ISCW002271 [Ixodes scapularis]|uniref:Uncharacterized protein n=1 Tax=Ixodes scapularis TaxID=6945 RepID=B7PCX3_IXOSC|nr:hypothetical protein IscW_ISCW002271 [Ixodes scapularis]|eukprot:XP_002410403.1 hypothetical protein IscW_ISCW002271 [Ixodes scapularis]